MLNKRHKIISISVLRGISVLLIILYHYTSRYNTKSTIIELGLTTSWDINISWGCCAVVTFFMMSGFLIGSYFYNKQITTKSYLINRFFRLYPSFWIGMIITYVTMLLIFPEAAVSYKAFLVNFTMIPYVFNQPCVDGAYWTMQVEFFFSVVIGIILLFSGFKFKRFLLLIWMILVLVIFFVPDLCLPIRALRFILIPKYAHMFIAGIATFLILNLKDNLLNWGILLLCCINQILYSETAIHNLFFLANLIILIYSYKIDRILKQRVFHIFVDFFSFCAKISYSWYLIHQMIGYAIIKEVIKMGYNSEWIIFIPIVFTGLIAFYINKYIETPTGRIGKQLSSRFVRVQ